jgi:acetylglutamate kinase
MASIALLLLIGVSLNIELTSSYFMGSNTVRYAPSSSSFSTSSSTARFALPAAEYDQLLKDVTSNLKKGSVVVVKYGGHAMENEELKKSFCNDIAALCRNDIIPVIVHGGGPQIAAMLKRLDIESKFLDGLRVTDAATMEVAQMVLCGTINKGIAASISQSEGVVGALGLCGLDAGLIKAKQRDVKLGLVGE